MGISATVMVADSALSNEHLGTLGIVPNGTSIAAELVIVRESTDRICVVRAETFTVVIGLTDQIAETIESERIAFPGTIFTASSVSSVGYLDFRVFVDGSLRRHLCAEEGAVTADVGAALEGESAFVFRSDDDEAEDGGVELDGDVLIDAILGLSGVAPRQSIFDLTGDEFVPSEVHSAPTGGGDGDDVAPPQGASRGRGFFRRMLGK